MHLYLHYAPHLCIMSRIFWKNYAQYLFIIFVHDVQLSDVLKFSIDKFTHLC